jgi:hypothetical protein
MQAYDSLNDYEIWSIYAFIESESRNLGIGYDEIRYTECRFDTTITQTVDSLGRGTGVFDTIISDDLGRTVRTTVNPTTQNIAPAVREYYEFNVNNYTWYNIDLYINQTSDVIGNFKFTIKGNGSDEVFACALFKNRNVLIPLVSHGKNYYMWNGINKDSIQFPVGIEMKIVAMLFLEDKEFMFDEIDIVSRKENNYYELSLAEHSYEEFANRMNDSRRPQ